MDATNSKKKPLLVSPDGKKQQLAPAALPAPVNVKTEVSLLLKEIKKLEDFPPLSAAMFVTVNLWALISACVFGGFSAYHVFGPDPCDRCSESTKRTCYVLEGASGDQANAMVYWAVWCSVLQAAAAVLALLLTPGRRRTLVTNAALAAATALHCMYARVQYLLAVAYPGERLVIAALLGVFVVIIFDLLCFPLLIIPVGDDTDEGKGNKQA